MDSGKESGGARAVSPAMRCKPCNANRRNRPFERRDDKFETRDRERLRERRMLDVLFWWALFH